MPQNQEILAQLDRILRSNVFANAARSSQFLSYCVTSKIHGENWSLKETSIAMEVFLREASYDPKVDPIVRVHARRVREKLAHYYRTTGRGDPILIELPKGSYVPQFLWAHGAHSPLLQPESEPQPLKIAPEIEEEIAESPIRSELTAIPVIQVTPSSPSEASASPRASHVRWIAVFSSLAIVVAVIGFSIIKQNDKRHPTSAVISPQSLRPVDLLPPDVVDVAWSPDQKSVAFVQADAHNRTSVYVMESGPGHAPRRLTHDVGNEYRPAWSPDGHQIALIRSPDDVRFVIVRVRTATGDETVTGPFTANLGVSLYHPVLDWSPDGKYLLTSNQVSPNVPSRLLLLRIADEARILLTSPPVRSAGDLEGKFSPDGRYVAFHRGGLGDLYLLRLNGESAVEVRQLTADNRGVRGIAFTTDSKNILFASDRTQNDVFGIYKIPVTGGTPTPVSPDGFVAVEPIALSQDVLAFRHVDLAMEFVEHHGNAIASPLFPGNEIDEAPAYAPDGNTIAFISTRSGVEQLWLYRRGDKAPQQLTYFSGEGFLFTPHWSPGGDQITFGFRENGATNIYVVNAKNGEVRKLTNGRSRNFNPVFSNDGAYIFFSSNEDGTPRLWRIAADGNRPAEPLFTQVVSNFATSSDGKWLYYIDYLESLRLCRLNLFDGTTETMLSMDARPVFTNSLVVTHEGIYVAVSKPNESYVRIERIDPNDKSQRTIWRIPAYGESLPIVTPGFDVAQDGSRMLATHFLRHNSTVFTTQLPGQP